MTPEQRIKLAEAMGGPIWEAYINPGAHPEEVNLPDPFTDANDDYAVLEWMREKYKMAMGDDYREYLLVKENLKQPFYYQIGDYARAALKVIE